MKRCLPVPETTIKGVVDFNVAVTIRKLVFIWVSILLTWELRNQTEQQYLAVGNTRARGAGGVFRLNLMLNVIRGLNFLANFN